MKNEKYGIDLEINFDTFKKGIQKAKETLNGLDEKFKTFKSNFKTGFNIDTDEADNQINKLNKSINETEAKLKELSNMKNPYESLFDGTNKAAENISDSKKLTKLLDEQMQEYKNASQTKVGLQTELSGMKTQKEDIGGKLDVSNLTFGGKLGQIAKQVSNQLTQAKVEFNNGIKTALTGIGEKVTDGAKNAFKNLGETIKNVAKNSVQFAVNMFKKLSNTILNAGKRLLGFNSQNNKMSGFLNKGIKFIRHTNNVESSFKGCKYIYEYGYRTIKKYSKYMGWIRKFPSTSIGNISKYFPKVLILCKCSHASINRN